MTATQETVKHQRTLTGKVVSDKMNKTIVVMVERRVKHPLLGKVIMRSARYKAHDETNQYKMGDTVEISESRPISRDKSWVVTRLIEASRDI
jgi:small subunit ribosomal protein S17